jgi:hypothetical protein
MSVEIVLVERSCMNSQVFVFKLKDGIVYESSKLNENKYG